MKTAITLMALALTMATPAMAKAPVNPQIDYQGFTGLVGNLAKVREKHRLAWPEFARRARAEGALLLDARSPAAFARGHLDDAVNLPFSDFTAEALAEVIGPNRNRPIYIYCNNNFRDNRAPVVTKAAPLALNIPTFINLHGYGYSNVWELADVIGMDDPAVGWVGTGAPRAR
ncbi:rhodanese-like domain-containing protein [Novosphingobium aquae]|uniref:Rhodanese-like domain-containing protein n=1 Tax=Novosphingobium aquae TaxID=3133435 RepID=A0ABU8SA07_9SPHN